MLIREITKMQEWPMYDNPPQLEGDWAVTSDFQIPHYSPPWVQRLIQKAKEHKVRQLLVAGDFYNFDAASNWPSMGVRTASIGEEREEAKNLVAHLAKHFDRIFIFPGNHDLRLLKAWARAMREPLEWPDITEFIFGDDVEVSSVPYQYAILNGQTRVTHPKNYSRIAGRVAARMADETYHFNIISAHGHGVALVPSNSGRFWCADTGGMFQKEEIPYKMLIDSLYPGWVNGFVIVKNEGGKDYPYCYNDLWTAFDD